RLYTGRSSTDEVMLTYTRELSKRASGSFSVVKYANPFYGTGTLIGGDISYRFTKKLISDFSVFYFPPMRSSNFGALGSGLTNSFTLPYPLTRDLSAFMSYYSPVYGTGNGAIVDETGAEANRRMFGNSISVGIMHSIPSLIKIGRMK